MASHRFSGNSTLIRTAKRLCAATLIVMTVTLPQRAVADPTDKTPTVMAMPSGFGWSTSATAINDRIDSLQSEARRLEKAFSDESAALGSESYASLGDRATSLASNAASLSAQIKSFQTIYESFLEIIGNAAIEGESTDITAQRKNLKSILADIRSAAIQSKLLELQGKQLSANIQRQQSHKQSALLTQKIPSPVTPDYWAGLAGEFGQIRRAFAPGLNGQYAGALHQSWLWPIGLILTGAAAALASRYSYIYFPRFEDRLINRIGAPPKAAGRPVFLSIMLSGLISAIVATVLWQLLSVGLFRGAGQRIAESLTGSIPLAAFLIGAVPFSLSHLVPTASGETREPHTYRRHVFTITAFLIIQSFLFAIAEENALPFYTRHLLEGIFAIFVTLYLVGLFRQMDGMRTEQSLFFMPSLRGIAVIASIVALVAVLLGYMVFAFFMVSNLVSFGLGCVIVLLLGLTVKELIAWIFGANAPLTRRLSVLGVGSRRVEQFGVVLNFVANVLLVIVLLSIALSSGHFDLGSIGAQLRGLFVGQSFHGFSLSLNTLLVCIASVAIAYYVINYLKRWLEGKLFPLTRLDVGTRSSITNVMAYVLWIAVLLLVLTEAGVAVQNLTWMVSALSVGIGFGLQSIVQNFVSGVILLAERPIRVGDLVEIGGVTGDVKKISVRATEITLGDGSTMIVPNSQFITSNVRNATMGSPISTMTANVTISTNADAAKAQEVLLNMMRERTDILQDPAPSVSIASISETGITLALSAKLLSIRDAGNVTNALMLDAYGNLRRESIPLGQPPAQFGGAAGN